MPKLDVQKRKTRYGELEPPMREVHYAEAGDVFTLDRDMAADVFIHADLMAGGYRAVHDRDGAEEFYQRYEAKKFIVIEAFLDPWPVTRELHVSDYPFHALPLDEKDAINANGPLLRLEQTGTENFRQSGKVKARKNTLLSYSVLSARPGLLSQLAKGYPPEEAGKKYIKDVQQAAGLERALAETEALAEIRPMIGAWCAGVNGLAHKRNHPPYITPGAHGAWKGPLIDERTLLETMRQNMMHAPLFPQILRRPAPSAAAGLS